MPSPLDDLGSTVRARRKARGWSLRTLADESGVSSAMLSDIERSAKSPTIRLAYQIARALGCSITDLLGSPGDASEPPEPAIANGRTTVLEDERSGIRRVAHTTPLQHGRLELVVYELAPGAESGVLDPNRAGTVETVAVLSGALELELDGRASRVDAETCVGHGTGAVVYRNVSAEESCRFLALIDTTRC